MDTIAADAGRLGSTLASLASDTVTTIVHSHTGLWDGVRRSNSAAIFQQGSAVGLYRKLYLEPEPEMFSNCFFSGSWSALLFKVSAISAEPYC